MELAPSDGKDGEVKLKAEGLAPGEKAEVKLIWLGADTLPEGLAGAALAGLDAKLLAGLEGNPLLEIKGDEASMLLDATKLMAPGEETWELDIWLDALKGDT